MFPLMNATVVTKCILLVDRDTAALNACRRALLQLNPAWQVDFANSSPRALDRLKESSVDAVVTDLVVPGGDGVKLLGEVMKRSPASLRVLVSEQGARTTLQRQAPAHQHLSKPYEPRQLSEALRRTFKAQDLLPDGKLRELVSGLQVLPSLPSVYSEVLRELESDEPSLERAGEWIARDFGLSARMLQVANSAMFGLPRAVTSPVEAAMFLGTQTTKALVLSLQTFGLFPKTDAMPVDSEQLWTHSWAASRLAKRICEFEEQKQPVIDEAFMAALLHDVGKLLLAANFPETWRSAHAAALERHQPVAEAEYELGNASHAEAGAYLLGMWGMPENVVAAVAHHHRPLQSQDRGFTVLTAVHVANCISQMLRPAIAHAVAPIDKDYLARVGCGDRLSLWWDRCVAVLEKGGL
jgi:putative nucleotidyltransferase with HDIG domain